MQYLLIEGDLFGDIFLALSGKTCIGKRIWSHPLPLKNFCTFLKVKCTSLL